MQLASKPASFVDERKKSRRNKVWNVTTEGKVPGEDELRSGHVTFEAEFNLDLDLILVLDASLCAVLGCMMFPLHINYFRQVCSSFGARFTNSLTARSFQPAGAHGSFPKVSPTAHKLVHLHMCHLEWWGRASVSILHWPQPQHERQVSATCGMTSEFFMYVFISPILIVMWNMRVVTERTERTLYSWLCGQWKVSSVRVEIRSYVLINNSNTQFPSLRGTCDYCKVSE